jgi:hypothetical protein
LLQRSRNAGFSCYNVTLLPESLCSTLLATVYKRPAEGGLGACVFAFGFCFGGFFGLLLLLWDFWCGKLLERKRITEGKRIAKGKSMAKEELIGSLHENFNTGLRKAKPKKEF